MSSSDNDNLLYKVTKLKNHRNIIVIQNQTKYISSAIYEGCSINKLQNDIILLIFETWNFGNIRFVENLIGEIYLNFYDNEVITVTSLVPVM